MLIDPYRFGSTNNKLLWLRAEETLGTAIPVDSSPYARVPYSASGTVNTVQTKCGTSVYGSNAGFSVLYSASEFPPFESSPFVIQFHLYQHGGDSDPALVSRMVQGESSSFGKGWKLRFSVGTGYILQNYNGSGIVGEKVWLATMSTGSWRHIAMKYTGSDVDLYVNGSLLTPDSGSFPTFRLETGAEFHIAYGRSAGLNVLFGHIDNFIVEAGDVAIDTACP